jgi:Na+/H+-dicarboxylate symporter
MLRLLKMPLLAKIAVALAAGAALGQVAPAVAVRIVNTFTGFFDQFIRFMVPLIIVGLVTAAIADTGRRAGRMLVATVALAFVSTILAGMFSYAVSAGVFPGIVAEGSMKSVETAEVAFAPFVEIKIPAIVDVVSALVLSFVFGLGAVFFRAEALKPIFSDVRGVVSGVIGYVIVPLLPFYIFGIFLDMSAAGKVKSVLCAFAAVVAVEAVITIVLLLAQYAVAGAVARVNPFRVLATMAPAYFTALGTSSSAATIPVTRNQTVRAGVRPEVADFTVPLCATVHLAGSTVKLVACAVALLIAAGDTQLVNWPTFIKFISMLAVVAVAAPGVPGGAVMASLAITESILGFGKEQTALYITLYIATDSFGTACNVTGDGAISLVVNRIFPKREG